MEGPRTLDVRSTKFYASSMFVPLFMNVHDGLVPSRVHHSASLLVVLACRTPRFNFKSDLDTIAHEVNPNHPKRQPQNAQCNVRA